MKNRWVIAGSLISLILLAGFFPAHAGDSIYGKVTEVRSASIVILDYGTGHYVVHLIGIDALADGQMASEAKDFVSKIVLGKNARLRLGSRLENGEMVGRLFTADSDAGIKDVGLELVRAGLVQRQKGADYQFDYKYNELSTAEREARAARRGLWAPTTQK